MKQRRLGVGFVSCSSGLLTGARQQKHLEQNVAAVDLLSDAFKPGARAGDRNAPGYFNTLRA